MENTNDDDISANVFEKTNYPGENVRRIMADEIIEEVWRERMKMGLYCFKGKYTKEALAAITRSGDNREKAIRGPIEKLGGKLHGWYGMFGEDYNFMVIAEMPGNAEYLAMAMAGIMGGALADFRTIALYTADDVVAGSKLFHERDTGYKAPGV